MTVWVAECQPHLVVHEKSS